MIFVILIELLLLELAVLALLIVSLRKKNKLKRKTSPKKKFSLSGYFKSLKLENYIVFFMYLSVFLVFLYFFVANVFPDNPLNSGSYELSASDVVLTNKLRSLYIDKDVLGGKTQINNKTARMIISEEPFNVVFNPKKVIAENTTATLYLSFLNPKTEVYLNNKLIIPDLEGYEKIKEYDNEEIWVKEDLIRDNYETADNTEDFLYLNFPQNSIYSFAELEGGVPILQDYEQTTTKIKTTFRDNLKLAVYAEGYLNIEFTKQDLNNLVGKDEYTVEIKDYSGKSYFKKVYEDDGEKKNTGKKGEEQDFKIRINALPRSIYYISFVKDKNNRYADSTIKDIKINSNKVLILDKFLPLDEFNFYTKVGFKKKIGFYYWSSKKQKVYISGEETKIINIKDYEDHKRNFIELSKKGDYYLGIYNGGSLWIYCDVISLNKDEWFNLPVKSEKKLLDSDVIIIDKNKLQIDEGKVTYKEQVKVNEKGKFKLQVLDRAKIYFRGIKLVL